MFGGSTGTSDSLITWLLWVAWAVVFVGTIFVLESYGGETFWPELIAGFGASLGAFVLALSWESNRERRKRLEDEDAARLRRQQEAHELESRLTTEVRRRFEPIRDELRRNLRSVETVGAKLEEAALSYGPVVDVLHPELLDGAWTANAPRLTQLVANYELTTKLASTYGRIEELRWRLRQRTATIAVMAGSHVAQQLRVSIDNMTRPLVAELHDEITDLVQQVTAQIDNPDVQPLGLVHTDAATVTGTGRIGSAEAGLPG